MAINLGVAIGPAVAGLLAGVNYVWLFVGDGVTCIAAGLVFYFYFRDKRPERPVDTDTVGNISVSPYSDQRFLYFIFLCFCYAAIFFQIFSGIPLYYKDVYLKPEAAIGLLIGFNGLIVFICEMPLVSFIEKRFTPVSLIVAGNILLGMSFILFNLFSGDLVLLLAMALLSISEMLAMPFMISHVVHSSSPGTRGRYLAAYTVAWALAFIVSPYCSTRIIDTFGFDTLWWIMAGFCFIVAMGFSRVRTMSGIAGPEAVTV